MDIANKKRLLILYPRADVVGVANAITQTENVISFLMVYLSTSYVIISGYKYMYDKYNDVYDL